MASKECKEAHGTLSRKKMHSLAVGFNTFRHVALTH